MSDQDAMSGLKEPSHTPVQETEVKESLSKQIIAGSPVNFSLYMGITKEDASSVHNSISELMKEHKHDREQLLGIIEKVENIKTNIDNLENVFKIQQNEIAALRQELAATNAEQSASEERRDSKAKSEMSDLQKQIHSIQDQLQERQLKDQPESKHPQKENVLQQNNDEWNTQADFLKEVQVDPEASEQMEERRRRRVSVQLQQEPVERPRIDSGVSVTSVESLSLASGTDSGMSSSMLSSKDLSSSQLNGVYGAHTSHDLLSAVIERPCAEDKDKTPICSPIASPTPGRKMNSN